MKQAVNSLVTYLGRLDPEERVRAADDVERMMETAGWQVYTDLLAKAVEEQRDITEAKTHEYAEYAAMHGRIRGLRFAQSITEAVVTSGERANDELRQIAAEESA